MILKAIKYLYIIIIVSAIFLQASVAQQNRQLSLNINRSLNGTGDLKGFGGMAEYGKYLKKKIELTIAAGANIHNGQQSVRITIQNQTSDGSLRFVTGGLQLNGQIHFAFVRTIAHELKLGVGPVLRYQASSLPDVYSIYGPSSTNIPDVLFSFRHLEDQEIFTAGYTTSLSYSYTLKSNYFVGAKAALQNDTNADLITQYGLRIGKRF